MADNLPALERQLEAADTRATEALERAREAEAEAQAATAERDSLLKIIEGIKTWLVAVGDERVAETIDAQIVQATPRKMIRGREAVRRVLREHGRPMRQRDLVKEVVGRGWIDPEARDPAAAIRVAARRLVDDGEVEKIADGVYRWKGWQPTLESSEEAAIAG